MLYGLFLLVRKCKRPKAHSYMSKWVSKDNVHQATFANVVYRIY